MELTNQFSKLRQYITIALFSFITFIFLSNCSEKPLNIDPNDILPDNDILGVIIDSIPVELYTVSLEEFETRSLTYSPLGCVNDTVIGILETDFICDFIYTEEVHYRNGINRDSTEVLDMTIELSYTLVYGDSMDVVFNVYELLEPMPSYSKSDYLMFSHMYSTEPVNDGPAYKGRLESEDDDSLEVYTITLKKEFAERFIDSLLIEDEGIYDLYNQDIFKDNFKGLYFAVEPRTEEGGGIIVMDHSASKMTLRTIEWVSDSSKFDTVSTVFYLGYPESDYDDGGTSLNMYRCTLNNKLQQIENDTLNNYMWAYVQSLAGTKVYIKLPTLATIRDTLSYPVSVNSAELVLPIDTTIYSRDIQKYIPPVALGVHDSETDEPIIDDQISENHLWGYFDDENYQYVLNIENHIHEYLRDDQSSYSDAFYLFAAKGTPVSYVEYTPYRVVLNGSKTSRPPYIRIIYSITP